MTKQETLAKIEAACQKGKHSWKYIEIENQIIRKCKKCNHSSKGITCLSSI